MDNVKSLVKQARKLANNKSSMPNFYEFVRRIECINKDLERVGVLHKCRIYIFQQVILKVYLF